MPGLNGAGPAGQGPMTGRGFGNCSGQQFTGRRRGMGFGRRSFGFQNQSKEERIKFLKEQKELIQKEIEQME